MIRKALKDDVGNLGLLIQSLSEYYLEDENDELPHWLMSSLSYDTFTKRIHSNEFLSLVYEKDDLILGYLCIQKPSHIVHLFVDKNHHKQGIAKSLWQHALSELEENLKLQKRISCYTVRSPSYSVPVFKALGFKSTNEIFVKDGIKFLTMEKSIKNLWSNHR